MYFYDKERMMDWLAKLVFDGRGKQDGSAAVCSHKYILTKIKKFISLNSKGSILIEFAI